jgi:hypothetical protein
MARPLKALVLAVTTFNTPYQYATSWYHVCLQVLLITVFKNYWFQHVHQMKDYRLPKQLLKYHPKGRR